MIALARCNKSKSFLLFIDVCVFLSICFSVPLSFPGYLSIGISLLAHSVQLFVLYSMYTSSPCNLGRIFIVFTNRQYVIQMLAGKLSNDPRNFVENKIKELLVHKCLVLSNKLIPCNFSSLGCIGFRTEVFELRL